MCSSSSSLMVIVSFTKRSVAHLIPLIFSRLIIHSTFSTTALICQLWSVIKLCSVCCMISQKLRNKEKAEEYYVCDFMIMIVS